MEYEWDAKSKPGGSFEFIYDTLLSGELPMYKQSRNQAIDECNGSILEAGYEVAE